MHSKSLAAWIPARFSEQAEKLRRSLARDRDLPLQEKVRKGLRFGLALSAAPIVLRGCDVVGMGARTTGRPVIENYGWIEIGPRVNIVSEFSPVQLLTSANGRITLGADVVINYGTALSAVERIDIGSRVSFGPFVTISDHDLPSSSSGLADPYSAAIQIGDGVWLATRVRVMKGASIGAGTIVTAGSVVAGKIPGGVIAGGNPARVIRWKTSAPGTERAPARERRSVCPVHALSHRLSSMVGPIAIPWQLASVDRVGARLRLLGAPYIENMGRITIGDDVNISSHPFKSQLITGINGTLSIGDGVCISSGASITADKAVEIGSKTSIGVNVIIMDTDSHGSEGMYSPSKTKPVVIGSEVVIEDFVTVLKGAQIGHGARIGRGSVVSGRIPAGALAAGSPARLFQKGRGAPASREP